MTPGQSQAVSLGLDKVNRLPAHSGYLELGGAWQPVVGPSAYGELGYKPLDWMTLFGRGEYDQAGPRAFGGLRFTF